MSLFLKLAYLFFIGSTLGWVIELFFRRFISSKNPERKWINPGFCIGPYLPLYGFGLCTMYTLAYYAGVIVHDTVVSNILMITLMAAAMTLLEFIAGIMLLELSNVRLWDYTKELGNIKGVICPKFTLIWAGCAAIYYFLIHPYILDAIQWLSENLAFSFVIGFFFGVFMIDVIYSSNLVIKIRRFAIDNDVIVKIETLKSHIRHVQDERKENRSFLFPMRSDLHITEHLRTAHAALENKRHRH